MKQAEITIIDLYISVLLNTAKLKSVESTWKLNLQVPDQTVADWWLSKLYLVLQLETIHNDCQVRKQILSTFKKRQRMWYETLH